MTNDAELEAQIRARDAKCVEIMFSSTVFQDRRTLLRLLDEARADYTRLATRLNDEAKAEREHCKDCCCARSWKALGITEYTGKSIPEHITNLASRLAKADAEIERLCTEFAEFRLRELDASAYNSRANAALRDENERLRNIAMTVKGIISSNIVEYDDVRNAIEMLESAALSPAPPSDP